MQLIIKLFGGVISRCDKQEFGNTELFIEDNQSCCLFSGISNKLEVMMSHRDSVEKIPVNFKRIVYTKTCSIASVFNENQKIYGIQFHPEVTHSEDGIQILRNFIFKLCKANINWTVNNNIDDFVDKIKFQVGDKKVILGLSGGIGSLVCALLINKAIKSNLTCVFINTDLLRKNDIDNVLSFNKIYDLNIKYIDFSDIFLNCLKNIEDPEKKRKIIGKTFINILKK